MRVQGRSIGAHASNGVLPSLELSASTYTWSARLIMSSFRRVWTELASQMPNRASSASAPRNARSAVNRDRQSSASGPTKPWLICRRSPPRQMTCTPSASASSPSVVIPLVMTVRHARCRSRRASWPVVVPASRIRVSPSLTKVAARRAICSFCAGAIAARWPSVASRSWPVAIAPPYVRASSPRSVSSDRSLRMVEGVTSNDSASCSTLTRPCTDVSRLICSRR